MELLVTLGRTLGFSLAAGVNLYATVALLGLAARYGWVSLPAQFQVFDNPWVIGAAAVLYVVEFFADKIPWIDTVWDTIHTFVRPVGGALIAVATLGDASPTGEGLVALLGGAVAAGSHVTKAGTRVAANASPEPFSNWVLSVLEDVFVVVLGFITMKFPLIALGVSVAILAAMVLTARWVWRWLRGAANGPAQTGHAGAVTLIVALCLAGSGAVTNGQQAPAPAATQEEQPLPRFRAGANLVRLDAYVTKDGQPVTDLTPEDFEVFEDDTIQKVENFELIRPRDAVPNPDTPSVAPSTREQRAAAQDPEARLFVLYLDRWHVGLSGSYRSSKPVQTFLDKVVAPNDLVAVMTPDMTPENMTLVRKGAGLDRVLEDVWTWGEREKTVSSDPREEEIRGCYPDGGQTAGIAQEMIERRREQKTLRSIDSMVGYLGDLREERKFVVLFSEGWVQFRRNDQLGRPLGGQVPGGPEGVGVGSDGRLTTARRQQPEGGGGSYDACERERVMLAYIDHELEVRQIAQRANRANVSFYPIDPRGLVAFDANPVATRNFDPGADRDRLTRRHDALKVIAEATDGAWSLNTNDTSGALERMLADTRSYYLLSYYSSNPKLDGRFRRISVRIKRDDVEVRHRMGYLAPSESEARAAGGLSAGRPAGVGGGVARSGLPPAVTRALDSLMPGRGTIALRVQATGLATRIRAFIELDAATAKQPEWQMGATLQISVEAERGGAPTVLTARLPAGQRTVVVEGPDVDLPPGRYFVRVEGRPERGSGTIRAATDATVGGTAASRVSTSLVVFRRGPTTGLAYQPTADPRFRRTERIRAELAILGDGPVTGAGRVLTREGQPLPLQVAVTERTDERSGARFLVAEVALAPLAQGDYVLEVQAGKESVNYGFRVVP